MDSRHYREERKERERIIKTIGLGESLGTFRIDKGHPNGAELHTITNTGIIIIRNERTNKMITKLIARPNQIRRYFKTITTEINNAIELARLHQLQGYNTI